MAQSKVTFEVEEDGVYTVRCPAGSMSTKNEVEARRTAEEWRQFEAAED